jgi:hypothetical protein
MTQKCTKQAKHTCESDHLSGLWTELGQCCVKCSPAVTDPSFRPGPPCQFNRGCLQQDPGWDQGDLWVHVALRSLIGRGGGASLLRNSGHFHRGVGAPVLWLLGQSFGIERILIHSSIQSGSHLASN